MNILYYPQMSMYDKQTKKLLPEADGNINMMRNTILEWKKYRPDDVFYILLPKELEGKKAFSVLPAGTKNATPLFYDSYVISARINRFNFPMNEFSSILKYYQFDLVLNDVIELTGNFKQMFRIEHGYTPKIISNIRHIDDKVNYGYMYRVLDGIEQSNLVTILSNSMHKKLKEQIQILTGGYNQTKTLEILEKKLTVFEPSVSYTELKKYKHNTNDEKVIVTFPGRLAKGEERRTNWDKFIEAIKLVRQRRNDFEVYFTDPNNAISNNIIEQEDWTKSIPKNREEFLKLLNKTDVIVSLMDVEGFGGISIREALLFNCRPVIPYVHEYKKMQHQAYSLFVESPIKVEELANKIESAIEWGKKPTIPADCYSSYGMKFTIEEQFKSLLPKLEALLNG